MSYSNSYQQINNDITGNMRTIKLVLVEVTVLKNSDCAGVSYPLNTLI
jgi:hypothetical protein